jgi:polyvinyl alcohol dehydrogenase (cytochrome)
MNIDRAGRDKGLIKIMHGMAQLFVFLSLLFMQPVQAQQDGAYLFETHCAICHQSSIEQQALGPELDVLRQMTPEYILRAMDTGLMRSQARERTRTQRYILAEYLSGKKFGTVAVNPIPQSAYCGAGTPGLNNEPTGPAWNGWGSAITNARFQLADAAGVSADDVPRLKLKWAFGYPEATSGGTQPVVVGGRLYVGNAVGDVYAIDAKSGCIHWTIEVDGGVRSAITVGQASEGGRLLAFFGDQAANAYAVDAQTGEVVWKVKVDEHPRAVITAAPALYEGRLYVPVSSREESQVRNLGYPCCRFRGSLLALNTANGDLIWKTYTIKDEAEPLGTDENGTQFWGPSGSPIWNAPTIDIKRRLLYIGTGNNYSIPATETSDAIIAFDMDDGDIRWVSQVTELDIWSSGCRAYGEDPYICPDVDAPDTDFGNSPVLVEVNGRDLLIAGNKLGLVYAFDPDDDGSILWTESTGKGTTSGGIMWGTATDGEKVYAANNYFNTEEPEETGGVSAIDLTSGRTVWSVPALPCEGRERCKPSHAAAVTVIPGVVFSGTMDGRLRALSTLDGRTLWEYDTAREFDTINGIKANGGSMSNAGVTVVDGLVYVNSGYSHHGAIIPGNVLLAFSVE